MGNNNVAIAGTGATSEKTATALIEDHLSGKNPDEVTLSLVLDRQGKSAGHLVLLWDEEPLASLILYVETGTQVAEHVIETADKIFIVDDPIARLLSDVGPDTDLLLAWNEDDEDNHALWLKQAQDKGARVLDLTDGLIEIRWEDEEDDEEAEVVVELPKVTAPVEDHTHTDWQTMMEVRQTTDPTSTRARVERKIAALVLQLEADIAQVLDEAGL
jgi:hypothetical protein